MSPFYSFLAVFSIIAFITLGSADDVIVKTKVLNDKEYYVGTSSMVNFYRAAQICAAYNMNLASVESDQEFQSLRTYLFNNSILLGYQYWLSGTNLPAASEYVWLSSGSRITNSKWAITPGSTANQCVRTNDNFMWVARPCTDLHYFICSRPLVPTCGAFGGCHYTRNPNAEIN
ncbi:C-type lectin mosGCTL-7-like [Musca autumnalis]|uniref:C-type lectin mosGCTL-7-like n=1 Tax=Musca autumnalis TaxID=221902 RepID=UPI003CFA2F87